MNGEKKSCRACKFSGCDPDGPYCVHPDVTAKHSWGLALSSQTLTEFCAAPELPLFQLRAK